MNSKELMCSSLVEMVQLRALQSPYKKTCIFLNKEIEEHMTYRELDQQAKAIAASIQMYGGQAGNRILLLFSPGLPLIQAFLGCLYAGCIAVPIYPPAQGKLLEKALRIIKNSQPKLVFMTSDHLMKFAILSSDSKAYFANIPCVAIDTIKKEHSHSWKPVHITGQEIAFLQYTSGSTMHPKGVMVSHHHLIDNIHKIYSSFKMNEETIMFSWLPPHHDMGLIGCILAPIYCGFPVFMMSPFSFLQNPLSWLINITRYKATISGSPNFAYDYCVKRIKEENKQGLDLSTWRVAFNGAEPVRKETLEQFYQAFKAYGLHREALQPCYGLAESTLLVSTKTPGRLYNTMTLAKEQYQDHRVHFVEEDAPGSHSIVSSGHVVQTVKIVDPDTRLPCDNDQVGEIWVQGGSVAEGYWQQEKETKHAFHGKIKKDTSKQTYLRTGDLGFIHNEELYVTGRIKDLIILYGKNHYPQDIEYSVLHAPFHHLLGKCAAFVMQINHEYKLTILCEVKNRFMDPQDQEELFNAIFELVYQNHQLEAHTIALIPLKSMPHTTSGKLRRNFCRCHLLDNTLPVVAIWQLEDKNKD